ncbi:hypothetical protein KAU08_11090, partial [bacterium]|nr:hypothetical protein [bacterium]
MQHPRSYILIPIILIFSVVGILSFQSPETPETLVEAAPVPEAVVAPLTPVLEANGDVILFDFESPEEVGRFVYGNINTYIESTNDVARTGANSCAATYYVGAEPLGKRLVFYTLTHPARARLADWSAYSEFQAAILNDEDFTVNLEVEYGDGVTSVWRLYSIPPGVWCRIRQPLSDLENEGLNLSTVKRISWSQLDTNLEGINTIFIDDVRLIASDKEASRA